MSTLALPGKFQVTFDPQPEEPSEWLTLACFVAGFVLGAFLATCFPLFR